jgi:hypothetical protein
MKGQLQRIAAGDRYLSALLSISPERAQRILDALEG